jgi:hypothetical protein
MEKVTFVVGRTATKNYEVDANLVWDNNLPQHYFGETIYNMLNDLDQETQEIFLPVDTVNEFESIIKYARLQRDYQSNPENPEYKRRIDDFFADLFSVGIVKASCQISINEIHKYRTYDPVKMAYIINFIYLADYLEIVSLLKYAINYFAQIIRKLIDNYPDNFLSKIAEAFNVPCTDLIFPDNFPHNLIPDIFAHVATAINVHVAATLNVWFLSNYLKGLRQLKNWEQILQKLKGVLNTLVTTIVETRDNSIKCQVSIADKIIDEFPYCPFTVSSDYFRVEDRNILTVSSDERWIMSTFHSKKCGTWRVDSR